MSQSHILVVDDEPDIRDLVREILEDEGYRVSVAENGEAARSAFARGAPDLVLLDIQLGDATGFDLLKKFEDPSFKVIFITAHDEFALQAFKVSALDFLLKPVSPVSDQ